MSGEERPSEAGEEPCRCHRSHASVTPLHPGHCCFFPLTQTCHAVEVAAWEKAHEDRWRPSQKGSPSAPGVTQ